MKAQRLRDALAGAIPAGKIDELVSSAPEFRLEPCEKQVTVMFIDIVGFSMTAEVQTPAEVFKHLKHQLDLFTNFVHQHGGIIDKNLGDGLLCFFGYDYVTQATDADHADSALYCAMDIQEAALAHALNATEHKKPIYPVRIGINTANVFIGDIGHSRRIDFTLIGHGVNFANRLESVCEPFMIMIGPATKDVLRTWPKDHPGLHRRDVQIKHHEQLFEAYEVDPFYADRRKLMDGLTAYRKQFNIQRKYDRIPVLERGTLTVDFPGGSGDIVNVSVFGFAVELGHYLAKGVHLQINIKARDPWVNTKIQNLKLFPLNVEVCWGGVDRRTGKYLHGLKIKGLNEDQCELLLNSYGDLIDLKRTA